MRVRNRFRRGKRVAGVESAAAVSPESDQHSEPSTSPPTDDSGTQEAAANSVAIAGWTLCSRFTGFIRVSIVAAVLGPTYLGSTFQATNQLPNLVFELFTGTLIISLLVPVLVQADLTSRASTERMAQSFLGLLTILMSVAAVACAVAAPLILILLTAGIDDPEIAAAQREAGLILLLLVLPQIPLYGVAYVGAAAMNARGRFKLAAAAPVAENVGIIATLGLSAIVYGTGGSVTNVETGNLILLGGGATLAVALHAALQWFGAARVGIRLFPRGGWSGEGLRGLVSRVRPSIGYSTLNVARLFLGLAVVNQVAGGVVAFMIGTNFVYLVVNAGARPVATAMLPDMSRSVGGEDLARFQRQVLRGGAAVTFIVLPITAVYLALAEPIARAASFGAMSSGDGVTLVATSLLVLAVGMPSEGRFVFGTLASYALNDAQTPFRAMLLRSGISMVLMLGGFFVENGPAVIVVVGLAMSLGNVIGAEFLRRRLERVGTVPSEERPGGAGRTAFAAAAAGLAAFGAVSILDSMLTSEIGEVLALAIGGLVGIAAYAVCSVRLELPGWVFFRSGIRRAS